MFKKVSDYTSSLTETQFHLIVQRGRTLKYILNQLPHYTLSQTVVITRDLTLRGLHLGMLITYDVERV